MIEPLRPAGFVDHVRRNPEKYFLVGQGSPELPTEVLRTVVWDALHRPDGSHGRIGVEIESDLVFTVESDQHPNTAGKERDVPRPEFFGSLLDMVGTERRTPAAAAALSVRTVVEVWLDGVGYLQELAGTAPTGPRKEFSAPQHSGSRLTFHLDPSFCGPDEAIAWALRPEELHGETCEGDSSPPTFPIHDLRLLSESEEREPAEE
ncbi:hypothetical protein [Streptomyces sp. S1]|uniref:hypothetical protein n=1 Tax=Streptomyces sp. S1 TaxID=718288 RepID=UPI003D71437B